MVYFCNAPAALDTVDSEQYAALKEFREWCKGQGLIEFFDNAIDFETKLRRHLQIAIHQNPYLNGLLKASSTVSLVGTPTVTSSPPDARAENASSLNEEARILLIEASHDKHGTILKLATLGGRYIQARGKTFGDPSDRRSSAKWEHALEQLVSAGYALARGHKDQIFELSEPGYRMAEYLETSER
jgi:hypothetical protein